MKNSNKKAKRLLRSEKIHARWDPIWNSISCKYKILIGIVLLIALSAAALRAWYLHINRFASTEKLTEVYYSAESEFEAAKDALLRLPTHPEDRNGTKNLNTVIRSADDWDPADAQAYETDMIHKRQGGLWISSRIPYSEAEYEQICEVLTPLFQKHSFEQIYVTPDRQKIFFMVYKHAPKIIGHADFILYDATSTNLEADALDQYTASLDRNIVDLKTIKPGWFAFWESLD